MRLVFALCVILAAFFAHQASAHEMRPAYLGMKETKPDNYTVLWKVPARGDRRMALYIRLPETCKELAEPGRTFEGNAYVERWTVSCEGGLKGQAILVDGLRSTLTDALARIEYLNATTEVSRLTPEAPSFTVAGPQTTLTIAGTYFGLGVDHILSGIDHLLFVFALLLLISDRWMLVKTITAFTVAHSLTLAGAALGYFSLPQKPVEAVIALSIAFVASELIRERSGQKRLSESYPWLIAFVFGLLHGFGFAGALKEIGLPQVAVPLALLTFNLGVEAGQLLFVGAILVVMKIAASLVTLPQAALRTSAAYLVGTIATFWLVERVASFWA